MESTPGRFMWKPGDDPNLRDGPGRTPLHHLSQQGQLGPRELLSLRQLLDAGANPNAVDGFGRTSLSLICMETGNHEAVRLLVESGADVHARDEWGRTALHWCCDRGWGEAGSLLLDHGADINAATKHGDSPLLWAAKAGRSRLVEMLLAAGCDLSLKNNRDERAIDVAADEFIATLIGSRTLQQKDATDSFASSEIPLSGGTAKRSPAASSDKHGTLSPIRIQSQKSEEAGSGGSILSTGRGNEPGLVSSIDTLRVQIDGGGAEIDLKGDAQQDGSTSQIGGHGRSSSEEVAFSQYNKRSSQAVVTGKKLKITLKKKT